MVELLSLNCIVDGDVIYPENSVDGFKDYKNVDAVKASNNANGNKNSLIRLILNNRSTCNYIKFYSRMNSNSQYPTLLPDKIDLWGSNRNTLKITQLDYLGTFTPEHEVGSNFESGIIRFDINNNHPYRYYLFNFQNANGVSGYNGSLNGFYFWTELELYGENFTNTSLVKFNNKIQTLSKMGEWIDTELNEPLTKEDFAIYGINDLSIISKEGWSELNGNFEILTWNDYLDAPQVELTIPEIRPYRLLDNPSIVTYAENGEVPILSQTVFAQSKVRFLVSKDQINYQVYKDNEWITVDKSNILEQGMTNIELEFIPQEVWAEWFENEAYKNIFDILVGIYSENPNKPLIRSITINYADNEAPIVIDAHIEPDTIHNEFATIKASVKDFEGDKISFKVLIKKAESDEFVQVSPIEGWYNRESSQEEIIQAFNFPYFNPGENEIKLIVKDERGAETEWLGRIILSNTDPIISLTYDDFSMKATIGDDDGDDISYRISVNGELIFDYINFIPTKSRVDYVFTENLNFGEENIIKLEVKDTHGGYASQEFTVIGTYRGLMFKNENGEYFVDSRGKVLMDLLFDKTLIGGQISETKKVTFENRHEFPLTNVKIEPENPKFVDGAVLEISETEMPFNPRSVIKILETMPILGEKDFYVRIKTDRSAHQGGYFYIKSTASPVIK